VNSHRVTQLVDLLIEIRNLTETARHRQACLSHTEAASPADVFATLRTSLSAFSILVTHSRT